ncbi:MAG: glycosyltransferase family 4 protein [Pseudomonadota bacterium]|nr:glycosyltransferase family 4 protein [Pseudomonadota bacterium]
MTCKTHNIGIGWQLHDRTGWGGYGINLALQLLSRPNYLPTLLFPPGRLPEHPLHHERLTPIITNFNQLASALKRTPGFKPQSENLTILHGLGNNFTHNESPLASTREAGVIFFENTIFNDVAKERAKRFPLIITGSHWNGEILKKNNFPEQIETVIQGIDPTTFHPAPKSGIFRNRFVIFSGGKLEYRKGQDIAIAAFKIFQERHPEALLLTAWHNSWPESMAEITTAGYVSGLPDSKQDQQQAIAGWLLNNGLKEDSFIVLPEAPNIYMAPVMREADVALFPNRGEGGTNLVAMEALACGIPTILAANSGQLDFADANICYPIKEQGKVKATTNMPGVEGWGESSIEEIVETLEEIYDNPNLAQQRARQATKHMQDFTWKNQVDKLLQKLNEFFTNNQ